MADQTSQVTGRPYSEKKENGYTIREFSHDTPSFEFVWHRDQEDRWIEPIGETDWRFQYDNEVPIPLQKLFIEAGTYHRVIRGTGELTLKIIKQNG